MPKPNLPTGSIIDELISHREFHLNKRFVTMCINKICWRHMLLLLGIIHKTFKNQASVIAEFLHIIKQREGKTEASGWTFTFLWHHLWASPFAWRCFPESYKETQHICICTCGIVSPNRFCSCYFIILLSDSYPSVHNHLNLKQSSHHFWCSTAALLKWDLPTKTFFYLYYFKVTSVSNHNML